MVSDTLLGVIVGGIVGVRIQHWRKSHTSVLYTPDTFDKRRNYLGGNSQIRGSKAVRIKVEWNVVGLQPKTVRASIMPLSSKPESGSYDDSAGDVATSQGPVGYPGTTSAAGNAPFVEIDLKVFSTLPDNADCASPAWWNYAGRWGVAMSSAIAGWDSGGRRIDFRGRSRAYWNTVWLQTVLP